MPGPIADIRRSYQLVSAGMTVVANNNLPIIDDREHRVLGNRGSISLNCMCCRREASRASILSGDLCFRVQVDSEEGHLGGREI